MSKPGERSQTLIRDDFKFYLKYPMLLWDYKRINEADSSERKTGEFYHNLLMAIFKGDDGFGYEMEYRGVSELGFPGRTACSLRYISQINKDRRLPKKIIFCGSGHKRTDSEAAQAEVWANALRHAVRHALMFRNGEIHRPDQPLYLALGVGTRLRFYELPPGDGTDDEAQDWAPAGGRTYELADDEERVWELWHEMRDLLMRQEE